MSQKMYSLYSRPRGTRQHWEKISNLNFTKDGAIKIFQGKLIANSTGQLDPENEYQVRAVK